MDSTEVEDLKSGKIFSMAPLGRRTFGATGGLLDGLPVICGGWYDNQIHSIPKDQSKFLGQLSVEKVYSTLEDPPKPAMMNQSTKCVLFHSLSQNIYIWIIVDLLF